MEIIKGKIQWIDILNPKEKELLWLKNNFSLHPIIIQELKRESARAKVEDFNNHLYLIYQFPLYDRKERTSRRSEIDIIVTKTAVITVHNEEIPAFQEFKKILTAFGVKNKILQNTLQLTYELLKNLINFDQRQLAHIHEKVEKIADELFVDHEKELLQRISYLKRDIAEHRLIVRSQEHLLKSFLETGSKFWGAASRVYLNDLAGEYLKLVNQLESYHETIDDFSETNSQLMNVKTNQVMKTFTILAFITFPLVLFANVLAIHAPGTPLVNFENGFWIIAGLMLIGMVLMLFYFQKKGWL